MQRSGGRGKFGFAFVDRVVSPSPCRDRTGAQPTTTQLAESHHSTDEVRVSRGVAWFDGHPEGFVEVPAWTCVLLCRRLHSPLPLSHRTYQCGRQLDVFGHHRAACSEAGVLGKRGFPLECAAAQVCREGGARVSTNMFVRDMDLAAHNALVNRRLEVVADGLTLWRGAQLAIDTTLVSPLRRDGTTRARAANHDGAALEDARRRKEATYPELSGEGGRARLVVLAAEVGGRWSAETAQFLTALAKARAQEVPQVLQGRANSMGEMMERNLACTAARAFTMLDKRPVSGTGEVVPLVVVLREARFL